MLSLDAQNILKNTIKPFSPTFIGVFGSYARGEQSNSSDIDILVDFKETIDLLTIIGLEQKLSELLGVKVDLVTRKSVNPKIQPYIEQDLIEVK